MPTPLKLELRQGVLSIAWSDGQTREYTVRELREGCPCATCREQRAPKPAALFTILKPEEARPLELAGMRPVGSYAYAIAFSDGHDTGIYTLEHLRSLGKEIGK